MNDNTQLANKSKTPDTAISHDPLFQQWVRMHQNSFQRDTKDNNDCKDAFNQDKKAIDARAGHQMNGAQKRADDRQDLQGDHQAIGDKRHPGADQRNAAADSKIVALDKALLNKYGAKLTADQRHVLEEDIAAKSKTRDNSKNDITREREYIQGDRQEIGVLKHGTPEQIEAANQHQIQMRQKDMALEGTYINDNNRSKEADKQILKVFGGVDIVQGATHPRN